MKKLFSGYLFFVKQKHFLNEPSGKEIVFRHGQKVEKSKKQIDDI